MTTIYPIVGKNSGKDVSVIITDSNGNQVAGAQIGILTHFSIGADYSQSETKSIINNGAVYYEAIPHGLKCSMKFSRTNSALQDMENSYRQNSYNGNQLSYTIQFMIQNRDGSINTGQLVNCKPHNWNLGEYVADQDVTQSVDFVSSDVNNNGMATALFPL
jgi:hypothetical protein